MNPVTVIRPGEDLVALVASRLTPSGNDYSRALVVFPGKRPAHFLRKALAGKTGGPILPPVIHSGDSFIGFLFTEKLGIQRPELGSLDAVAILYELHLAAAEKLGGERYVSLDAFLPLGLKLFSELEEVAMANMPAEAVGRLLREVQFPRFHSLGYYYEKFYAEVEKRGAATRSSMARTVSEKIGAIDLGDFETVQIAGFYAFTPAERKIVTALRKRPNVWLTFQAGAGLEQQLLKLDIEAEVPESPPPDPDHLTFTKAPDTHGQMFALAATLNDQLARRGGVAGQPAEDGGVAGGNVPEQSTAIVLPSAESLFPLLRFPLTLIQNGAYNIAMGYPLLRTPVYGFLNTLMDVLASYQKGEVSVEAYLGLLLHPHTKNIRYGSRADLTRVFFHTIEEFLAERKGRLRIALDELENDGEMLRRAADRIAGLTESVGKEDLRRHLKSIHTTLIRNPAAATSVGHFAQQGIEVLGYIFEHSTANLHPLFRPFVERAIEVLNEIAGSLLAGKRFTEIAGYATFIKRCLAAQTVPFPGTPLRGLQVLGLLETRNLTFDTLYILDVNDDVLPGSPGEDLLLPQPVRRMLGLETSRDREQLTEYYFSLAVASAKDVHLFYTESTSRWKSRYVERLLWQIEKKEAKISPAGHEQSVRYRINLANARPRAIPKTAESIGFLRSEFRHSASSLDDYVQCGLRFYYRYVLGLREREEASSDIDPTGVGKLVHLILRRFYEPLADSDLTPARLVPTRLRKIVQDCFREAYGAEPIGPAYFMRSQVISQLTSWLEDFERPRLAREPAHLVAVEQVIAVERQKIPFTGRIDRIERRGERTVIIDYKTGKDDALLKIRPDKLRADDWSTWGEAVGSFQLPIYILLYSSFSGISPDRITPVYQFLGRSRIDDTIEAGLDADPETAAGVYRTIEPVIFNVVEDILDPERPFTPPADLKAQCPRCPFVAICGTQWVDGRGNS